MLTCKHNVRFMSDINNFVPRIFLIFSRRVSYLSRALWSINVQHFITVTESFDFVSCLRLKMRRNRSNGDVKRPRKLPFKKTQRPSNKEEKNLIVNKISPPIQSQNNRQIVEGKLFQSPLMLSF